MKRVNLLLSCATVAALLFVGGWAARPAPAPEPKPPCRCRLCDPGESERPTGTLYEPHAKPDGTVILVPRPVDTALFGERMRADAAGRSWAYYEPAGRAPAAP